jgi:hypothetical protein
MVPIGREFTIPYLYITKNYITRDYVWLLYIDDFLFASSRIAINVFRQVRFYRERWAE